MDNASPHVERAIAGLLALAAEALQQIPKNEALDIIAAVEVGAMVLSFEVSATGKETVIDAVLSDPATGERRPLRRMSILPPISAESLH